MRALLALLAVLLAAAAPPIAVGPLEKCTGSRCDKVDLVRLDLAGREARLVRTVWVRAQALPLERPLMVRIVAMASAEVRWNGVVIGRNGVPGRDSASETPGRFVASFLVPPRLVRANANEMEVRLSAHHLWLPVRRAVHMVAVTPYESEELPGLADYLPALLALGALVAGSIYFAVAWASDRSRSPLLLALAASAAILQLLAEVSRAFVAYSYPWHLARVSAIALLAALVSMLIAAYAASRFAPERTRGIVLATAGAAAVSLLLVPWYDVKAMSAIFAGLVACAVSALPVRKRPAALAALAMALAASALLAWQLTAFLDRGWFLLLALLFVALVAEQVHSLRRARAERDEETRRAAALTERLVEAERAGEPVVALKDGSRTRRVAASDILYIRAADDYCEAVLSGGQTVLVTTTLAKLLETLPPRFVRVHRSFAVNRAHVAAVAPKAGGGRELSMSDGMSVPVGRSYAAYALGAIS